MGLIQGDIGIHRDIMEKKMETTVWGIDFRIYGSGFCAGSWCMHNRLHDVSHASLQPEALIARIDQASHYVAALTYRAAVSVL